MPGLEASVAQLEGAQVKADFKAMTDEELTVYIKTLEGQSPVGGDLQGAPLLGGMNSCTALGGTQVHFRWCRTTEPKLVSNFWFYTSDKHLRQFRQNESAQLSRHNGTGDKQ